MTISAHELRASPLEALERLYREAPLGPVPSTSFRGEVLHRVDTRFARSRTASAVTLPFERLSFGVDFGRCTWFFVHSRLRAGHFRMEEARSRWRDTMTLRLTYETSRLPFRSALYDEVKPLSDTLALGLGGLNWEVGTGDLFFFLLEAQR